jgi:hypothetical protein
MAEYSQAILGDHLAGLLVGQQPDLYATSGLRPYDYSPSDYSTEFARLVAVMQNGSTPIGDSYADDPDVPIAVASNNGHDRASRLLIGPNIVSGGWTPEQVWYTGFVDDHADHLAALSVQQ